MKNDIDKICGNPVDDNGNEIILENEVDHFYTCKSCGQAVDKRSLGQVFHHEDQGHKPIDLNS